MINIHYDYWTLVQLFLANLIFIGSVFLLTKIFLKIKMKDIIKKRLLILIPLLIISYLAMLCLDYKYQVLICFIIVFIIIKLVFKKNFNDTLFLYLSEGLVYFLTTYFFTIVILILHEIINLDIYSLKNTFYEIIIVSLISLVVSLFMKKLVNKLFYKVRNRINLWIIILIIIDFLELFIAIYSLSIIDLNILKLIINFLSSILLVGLSIFLIKQNIDKIELTEKYQLLEEYISTSSDLIEKYSATIHKYKNNLITLKSYIKNDKNEALTYINSLIGDYKKKKYNWLTKINYINEDSIRYLVYYKLSKAEEIGLKITIDISKGIKDINYNNLKINEINMINDILGEYFDNAIYASLESDLKELDFMVYQEDKNLIFLISNTYKENIDLSLIEEHGYTTKGKGHGLGLYFISKSIKNKKKLKYSYEILDNYFIAKLIVKLNND